MKVLYIDTSSSFLTTGIVDNDTLMAEINEELNQDLSRLALPKIAEMFKSVNLKPQDIDKIIVVDGPGSFTGIRIGITIAKIYAYTLGINITTISSLEAMAVSYSGYDYYVPMIDARRGYVYTAIFNSEYKEVFSKRHTKLEEVKKKILELDNCIIITNDDIDIDVEKKSYKPDIHRIVDKYKNRKNVNPHSVNPNYLKLTEAEEKLISSK